MANILIKQGLEIAVPDFVITTDEARKVDLTDIIQTGTTSSQAISAGTYFYLNNVLVRAKVAIANGATFTLNTNYEVVTAGALNELKNAMPIFLTFPKTDVAITIATGAVYRSAPIECDTGIDLTNKKIIVGADGGAWNFLNSVSGTKFTVTLMRSSSATIDSNITVCISN